MFYICKEKFYQNLRSWKITYEAEADVYYLRERDEHYDNEVDVYANGKILTAE